MARTQRQISSHVLAIADRLIGMLQGEFGLTMTEAANQLGYKNATTLHKIKNGKALPDPARLAHFAESQAILGNRTMNLHWVWTGRGPPLISRAIGKPVERNMGCDNDDDFINTMASLTPSVKKALLVLIARHQ